MIESSLTDEEQSLLAEVLTGKRPADDPRVAAVLARVPQAHAELAGLQRLDSVLQQGAKARRAEFVEAMAAGAPHEEIARLESLVAAHCPARPHRTRRQLLAAGAAAAALVGLTIVWWLQGPPPAEPAPDPRLGPQGAGSPSGEVAQYGAFVAGIDVSGLSRCYFVVFEAANGARREVARSDELRSPRWQPDAAQSARIEACARIEWRLHVTHPEQQGEQVRASGQAWRR